jgi:hypothetical protein
LLRPPTYNPVLIPKCVFECLCVHHWNNWKIGRIKYAPIERGKHSPVQQIHLSNTALNIGQLKKGTNRPSYVSGRWPCAGSLTFKKTRRSSSNDEHHPKTAATLHFGRRSLLLCCCSFFMSDATKKSREKAKTCELWTRNEFEKFACFLRHEDVEWKLKLVIILCPVWS